MSRRLSFRTYKTWYYGFYLNSVRNITVDSCTTMDSDVGIYTFIIAPSGKMNDGLHHLRFSIDVFAALTHIAVNSRVTVTNSIIVGSITPDDCHDRINPNSMNVQYSDKAVPTVSWNSTTGRADGRVGIVFLTASRFNSLPIKPFTGIVDYPCRKCIRRATNRPLMSTVHCSSERRDSDKK